MTDKCEIHSALRHYLRAVGFFSRLEKGVDIRHKAGCGIAGLLGESVNFIGRNTNMVQPLAANLFAGAVTHRFFYIVALFIRIERIKPYQNHALILGLELWLTVDCPGKIPVVGAVLNGYNTAGRYLSRAWVAFADIHNMPDDLLVGCRYGCTHPVGGIDIAAEDIRIPELSMLGLGGDGLPHIPRFAAAVVNDRQVRGVGLVAVTGSIGAATVGIALGLDYDIFYVHTVLNLHAVILQIFYQRQDHTLILVVFGETQGAEIRQAVNMMHIAAKVTLHFQSARPALEGKHRLPIEPEICVPEGFGKHIGNLFIFQILFLC